MMNLLFATSMSGSASAPDAGDRGNLHAHVHLHESISEPQLPWLQTTLSPRFCTLCATSLYIHAGYTNN